MDKPKHIEIPLELLGQLFPWPEEVPLPKPRFGKPTRQQSDRLPDGVERFAEQDRPPFRLVWDSDDLGLKIRVEEEVGEHAGQLSAQVRSSRLEHLGKQAKVVLIGKSADLGERHLLVTVDLDEVRLDLHNPDAQKPVGCFGWLLLGTPQQLRAKLGDGEVAIEAFLLV